VALALGRATVSFQFQSVTPLADSLRFGVTPSTLGVLLGAYMAPGVVAAVAAPLLLSKLGWKRILCMAFSLMALGQIGIMLAGSSSTAVLSRLVAGAGGCVVYVVTVGFVAQLVDGGPIARRMGVIASSWPWGNALALVVLGVLPLSGAIRGWVPALAVVLAAALIFGTCHWRSGDGDDRKDVHRVTLRDWGHALWGGLGVAVSFGLYNVAFILLTSFSPELLSSRGFPASTSAAVASIPMWLFIASVPVGGIIAAKLPGRERVLVALGLIGSALALAGALGTSHVSAFYVMAGLLGGLPTAPMWASAAGRATRTGHLAFPALFVVFFSMQLIFPPAVGVVVEHVGSFEAAIAACIVMLVLATAVFYVSMARKGAFAGSADRIG